MDKKINDKKRFIISVVAFVLVIALAFGLYTMLKSDEDQGFVDNGGEEDVKTMIENFSITDKDGNEVFIHDLKGKPTVINFWASWCPPCKAEMPDFNKIYKEMGDEVNFAMVNMTTSSRETEVKAKEFIEENGFEFPVYYDIDGDVANTYQINAFPTTFFIDKDGYLVAYAFSQMSEESILKGIKMAKGEWVEPVE